MGPTDQRLPFRWRRLGQVGDRLIQYSCQLGQRILEGLVERMARDHQAMARSGLAHDRFGMLVFKQPDHAAHLFAAQPLAEVDAQPVGQLMPHPQP